MPSVVILGPSRAKTCLIRATEKQRKGGFSMLLLMIYGEMEQV